MAPEDFGSLPVSMLKAILFSNHVNARNLIEKSDLVERVKTLVDEERKDRQREAMFREREEAIAVEQQRQRLEELERERQFREHPPAPAPVAPEVDPDVVMSEPTDDNEAPPPLPPKSEAAPVPKVSPAQMSSSLERTGLCVICQDEEANIAIVDCGYAFAALSSSTYTLTI